MKMGAEMNEITAAAMALTMLAAILLTAAGIKLSLSRATRVRGVLMIVASLVLVVNVAMWAI
jgi:hypothetical protein